MNDVLKLKGNFEQKQNNNKPGPSQIPKGSFVSSNHISDLIDQLESTLVYWKKQSIIKGALISAYYIDIVAKSSRLKRIFNGKGKRSNDRIVGVKFSTGINKKHIVTYFVPIEIIENSINELSKCLKIVTNDYKGKITFSDIEDINDQSYVFNKEIKKTCFVDNIFDCYHLEKFSIDINKDEIHDYTLTTIYDVNEDVRSLLNKIGLVLSDNKIVDETTLLLLPEQYKLLLEKVPYLIAMNTKDLASFGKESLDINAKNEKLSIENPKNEPIIGVIDTLFDESVYFSKWVEVQDRREYKTKAKTNDYVHGTEISSIIVDGPRYNPSLEDNCGRFRVKHFAVASNGMFKPSFVLKEIEQIVKENQDIKVWNLSFGSDLEINENFISPEGAILDKIQNEYDVIFVIAGTNKPNTFVSNMKIGSPADSINSIVVNSVRMNNEITSYSRRGMVLSFFTKPDICYYGGDIGEEINVYAPNGIVKKFGTSLAAPWIARKLAYLIHIQHLNRELAKALIIDSAIGWKNNKKIVDYYGYGIVPIDIREITHSKDDEIRFMIYGTSENYYTYNFSIPVPFTKNNKYPFKAKATMCYFPKCNRNQGVDYTNTELSLTFGRLYEDSIKSINNYHEDEIVPDYLKEENARKLYRKWDNVKHVGERISNKSLGVSVLNQKNPLWGIRITSKNRLNSGEREKINFGLVISLKEVNGVNRIEEFIQLAKFNRWDIERLNEKTNIEIFNKSQQKIEIE